jgi:hypothetical protein
VSRYRFKTNKNYDENPDLSIDVKNLNEKINQPKVQRSNVCDWQKEILDFGKEILG